MPEPDLRSFRVAVYDDTAPILRLLRPAAEKGLILPRTYREIANRVSQFVIAEDAGQIVGCVTHKDYSRGLFEVRSLVVAPEMQGRGIGSQLVREIVKVCKGKGARRIFALTYRPRLFEKLGFCRVEKNLFPEKVWDDCLRCPKRDSCDETAMLLKYP